MFNGLLRTYLGATEDESGLAYLRPETAQGIFINFRNVLQTSRKKIPFGIGQIGKSFRNEITPGNFIFRTREFEQMEMEFFVKPGTDEEWHEHWIAARFGWYTGLGVREENLRLYEHPTEKRSHYSKRTVDVEYRYDFAGGEWGELEGIANRTDFDLSTHAQRLRAGPVLPGHRIPVSGSFRTSSSRRPGWTGPCWSSCWTPTPRTRRPTPRATWRSGPCSGSTTGSPRSRSRCCRCPATPTCRPKARDLAAQLRKRWNTDFDDASAIGRRYRRQDEIGTPVLRHRRLRHPERPGGHRAGTRLDAPGPDRHRRARVLPFRTSDRLLIAPCRTCPPPAL